MWSFMCEYADMFNANVDRVIEVLMAWVVSLLLAGAVVFILFCFCCAVYVMVCFYIEDLREERGVSDV